MSWSRAAIPNGVRSACSMPPPWRSWVLRSLPPASPAPSSAPTSPPPGSRSRPTGARWSAHRTRASSSGGIETTKAARRLEIGADHLALALSPDGRTAAVGTGRGVRLVDTRTGTARTATGVLSGAPSWLLFSPDGKTVVSTSLDGTVALWDWSRPLCARRSVATPAPPSSLSSAPTRRCSTPRVTTARRSPGAWRASAGWEALQVHARPDSDPAGFDGHPEIFSPDGSLAAVGLKDEGIRLWDTTRLVPVGPPLEQTSSEGVGARLLPGRADARGRDRQRSGNAVGRRAGRRYAGRSRSDVALF